VLPNLAALSDLQAASVQHFVDRGGSLIATGQTSLYNEWGQPRADFALADLFGAQLVVQGSGTSQSARYGANLRHASETLHTYLGIHNKPEASAVSREILSGFEDTDILPFGGWLGDVIAAQDTEVLLTYVPPFPVYPPETSWMREPRTSIAGLIVNRGVHGSRIAFLPADVDRRFGSDHLPDHARLLINLVRWASGAQLPFRVTGPGLVDCHLYRQSTHLIFHLVNLTTGDSSSPVEELIPVGPLKIEVRLTEEMRSRSARLLVAGKQMNGLFYDGTLALTLPSLLDHEVIVIG
jgi:hypothetical protein